MGFQVGNTCYEDRATAENVYFSSVVPVITADSSLKQLRYEGGNWKYGNHVVHAYLPECSPEQNFEDGFLTVAELLPTAVMLFVSGMIISILRR